MINSFTFYTVQDKQGNSCSSFVHHHSLRDGYNSTFERELLETVFILEKLLHTAVKVDQRKTFLRKFKFIF